MEAMNNIALIRTIEDEEEEEVANQMTGFMSLLPIDIIFDILSRIPIKSLSQCRWVCKPWYQIITTCHRFAKFQLAWATQNHSPCLTYFQWDDQKFYPIHPQVFDHHETSITLTSPKFPCEGMYELVGSCNGLICLSPHRGYNFDPYYVLNPVTGDYIIIPLPPSYNNDPDIFNSGDPDIFGFGFDPITNHHKVIRIMWTRKVEIFTLGSHKWTMGLNDIPDIYARLNTHTVFFNGALHWIVHVKEVNKARLVIVSFDMATENFQEFPLPLGFMNDKLYDAWYFHLDLGVIGGCLCFIDAESSSDNTEIWVMKSYGVQGSWHKEYVLRKNLFSGYGKCQLMADEVIKLKNGELVLAKSMHYYDPQSNVYTAFVTHGKYCRANNDMLQAITHAGTIISPKNIGRSTQRSICILMAYIQEEDQPIPKYGCVE